LLRSLQENGSEKQQQPPPLLVSANNENPTTIEKSHEVFLLQEFLLASLEKMTLSQTQEFCIDLIQLYLQALQAVQI
jgi:hypothetical protein